MFRRKDRRIDKKSNALRIMERKRAENMRHFCRRDSYNDDIDQTEIHCRKRVDSFKFERASKKAEQSL